MDQTNYITVPILDDFSLKISRLLYFSSISYGALVTFPAQAFTLITYKQATVQKNYHVFIGEDKHYYSIPHQYIGKKVELRCPTKK